MQAALAGLLGPARAVVPSPPLLQRHRRLRSYEDAARLPACACQPAYWLGS